MNKNASQRRAEILRIVRASPVHSQEELIEQLEKAGFASTQPTVSRDIRELGLLKTPSGYVVPGVSTPLPAPVTFQPIEEREERLRTQLAGVDITAEKAGNFVIVKTPAAGAGPVAHAIDAAAFPEALGTIAGDDTIFIAARTPAAAARLLRRMGDMNVRRPPLRARRQ